LGEVEDDLREDLHQAFGTSEEEPVSEEEPDDNTLRNIIIAALLLFFLLGSRKREDELDDADLRLIEEQRDLFLGSLETIVDRIGRGVATTGTIERLVSQAASLYWRAFVKYADATTSYIWRIDPEKDHCSTCLGQDGVTRTGEEWRQLAEEQGIWPRSPNLECTGRFCGCSLEPV
jgi:hypothetical protein